LQNPWLNMVKETPYILKEDEKNFYQIQNLKNNVNLNLLPEPYVGDLNAPIYLLTYRGSIHIDDFNWHKDLTFKDLYYKSIEQKQLDKPFIYFDEALSETPAAAWWHSKLYKLIENSSLDKVAKNICSVQFLPYHSSKQPSLTLLRKERTLPSQFYGKYLVEEAIKRDALIVVMSGPWLEFVPQLRAKKNVTVVLSRNNPVISTNNLENPKLFDKMVALLKD
jgi:hypothetical protein